MRDQTGRWALAALAATCLGGCAMNHATRTEAGPPAAPPAVHANLVTASPLMIELDTATGWAAVRGSLPHDPTGLWAALRNDDFVPGAEVIPDVTGFVGAEYWYAERLRITNGRPREHSTFRGRSYGVRPGR